MKLQKTILLLLSCLLLSVYAFSGKPKYRITVKIEGVSDSLLVMASYVGDKQFIVDTAYPDKQFVYKFEGDSLLPDGMYAIATPAKAKLFDFIISEKRIVDITGKKNELPISLRSKEDDENKILFDYINFLSSKQKEMSQLQQLRRKFKAGTDSIKVVDNKITLLNEEVQRYITGIINTYHGKFISVFLKSLQEPEIKEPPILSNGRPDSTFAYRQYKQHFFDNIDLADSRVIRTPVIHSKIEQYIDKMTVPAVDSIIASIDHLFTLSKGNKDTFKYLIWYLTVKFESSEIMGHDAVFVHLVDKYYDNPNISFMYPTVKQNLIKRAAALRPILIGKPAPDMILLDTLQFPVSLRSLKNRYTIIYFWDPECGHCKKETPLLKEFYESSKALYDLEVYGVCMDTSWKDMKQYIRKNHLNWINVNGYYSMTPDFRELYDVHSSPVMYLLDEKKTIIAKRVLTEQMKGILKTREKQP